MGRASLRFPSDSAKNELRCGGNGAAAQAIAQNVAQFLVTYLVQTVDVGTGTTVKYVKGSDIATVIDAPTKWRLRAGRAGLSGALWQRADRHAQRQQLHRLRWQQREHDHPQRRSQEPYAPAVSQHVPVAQPRADSMRAPREHCKSATMPHSPRPDALRPNANCGHGQPLPAVPARQRGVALFVVIVFVMLSMLLALWASRTSLFNEMVVGNDADYQRAFEAAQALLQDAELDIRGEMADGSLCSARCAYSGKLQFPGDTNEINPLITVLKPSPRAARTAYAHRCVGRQDFWNYTTAATTVKPAANTVSACRFSAHPVSRRWAPGMASTPARPPPPLWLSTQS